ncbi:HlyD family efflux transporter periplasmic adaptor subunit [Chitinophaga sp. Mgbs1]|uniref:HlyD family efflux transporter periplasmic adaptor subunit n=1 Tax=Chitinophaga solisilvae TaxID=1233460 RepID=A0A3S1D0U1_9BACT|nr:HlyD family efflux transporter periplasmic adaptor subunit [Chitinophaga solisilvae]
MPVHTPLPVVIREDSTTLPTGKDDNRLQLRSEIAQEIITRKPDLLERWALFIFGGILVSVFACSWFISYPDIVNSRATLTAANAPKEIVMRTDGRLVKLLAQNNTAVSAGTVIGWIESTASHTAVLQLAAQLDQSIALQEAGHPEQAARLFRQRFKTLGELQAAYQQFITAWQQYNDYIPDGFYLKRKKLLQHDITDLELLQQTAEQQKIYTAEDITLAAETFKMNDSLLKDRVISPQDFRNEKSKFLGKQSSLPQMEAAILNNRYQQRDKLKAIQQVDHDISQQEIIFLQATQSLKSAVDEWMKKFLLQSPIDGKITFTISLQENQFLPAGRLVGYINPPDSRFFAETYLSQRNLGKIDTGFRVQLRFEAYPYQEFGYVPGTIDYISHVATDSGFMATIRLDSGLQTDQRKAVAYKNGLKAQGLIITRDMRLLERFYYDIVKATSAGNR